MSRAVGAAPKPESSDEASPNRDIEDLELSISAIQPLIHQVELKAADLGIPIAPLYLTSARGSLRHASACVAQHAARAWANGEGDEVVLGSGIRLQALENRPAVGQRCRSVGRRDEPKRGLELSSWARRPDLGADLMASPAAKAFCSGPVGSTLLFCALAHHRWLHVSSRTKWSTDLSGARALVAAINDGSSCAIPTSGTLVELIDEEVMELLSALGWSRMLSSAIPGVSGN